MKSNRFKLLCLTLFVIANSVFAQIPSNVPTNGLVGWWPFNGNATDESINTNDGTSFQTVGSTDRFGNSNAAFYFNGIGSYVEVPHHADLNSMPISFSYWTKSAGNPFSGSIINKYCCSTWDGYIIDFMDFDGNNYPETWEYAYFRGTCNGIFQTYCNPFPFPTDSVWNNQWHHFVFIVDVSGAKVYRDGEIFMQEDWFTNAGNDPIATVTPVTNNLPVHFGSYNTASGFYKGNLDDIGIWNRALTEAEVIALYGDASVFCNPSLRIFQDFTQNCQLDAAEGSAYIPNIQVLIEPGEIYTTTDNVGEVFLCEQNLPDGNYTATIGTSNIPWETDCATTQNFTIANGVTNNPPLFALYSTSPCASPNVSIICPTIRRCSEHTWPIYVSACNLSSGTDLIYDAYVDVALDSFIFLDNATLPYQDLGSNIYRFTLGDIAPGQCTNIVLNANFGCEFDLDQTVCMEAKLYPVLECELDDEGEYQEDDDCENDWDHSDLDVEGWCDGDSIHFDIHNRGTGNMDCHRHVNLFVDQGLLLSDSVRLNAGATKHFTYQCNGETYIMQTTQHPWHPGNSHPNDHVENCGGGNNWTPGYIDDYPEDDEDAAVDIFCGQVVGSFDPNDKRGLPDGFGETHDILPGQKLQYIIRFQNTGTAEAYTVVVRDTLESDLNILSVVSGASSHNYSFVMKSPRVLEWTFNNIMLPDSNTNEEGSHGFLTFTVEQIDSLVNGTQINNSAAIYFDSNEPVITNTTLHTINDQLFIITGSGKVNPKLNQNQFVAYPNPNEGTVTIEQFNLGKKLPYDIIDLTGRVLMSGTLENQKSTLDLNSLPLGMYLLRVQSNPISVLKLLKK